MSPFRIAAHAPAPKMAHPAQEPGTDQPIALEQALRYAQDLARLQHTSHSLSTRFAAAAGTRRKILVVDDEPAICELVATTLGAETSQIFEAGTGSAALELAHAERPDFIVLDIQLPDINGIEVCTRLKADLVLSNIPVVLLTAHGEQWDREAGSAAGAAHFLTKPFSPIRLLDVVHQLLD